MKPYYIIIAIFLLIGGAGQASAAWDVEGDWTARFSGDSVRLSLKIEEDGFWDNNNWNYSNEFSKRDFKNLQMDSD